MDAYGFAPLSPSPVKKIHFDKKSETKAKALRKKPRAKRICRTCEGKVEESELCAHEHNCVHASMAERLVGPGNPFSHTLLTETGSRVNHIVIGVTKEAHQSRYVPTRMLACMRAYMALRIQ